MAGDLGVVDRLEEPEENDLLLVEVVVGAVDDRRDPPDDLRPARRQEQLDLRVAKKGVFVGEDLRDVRPKRGNPVRVAAVQPIRDVEEAAEVALAATDPLDSDRCRQTPTGRRIESSRATFSMASSARVSCSRVWVAMSDVRMRARPGGVAGEITQFTKTPSS